MKCLKSSVLKSVQKEFVDLHWMGPAWCFPEQICVFYMKVLVKSRFLEMSSCYTVHLKLLQLVQSCLPTRRKLKRKEFPGPCPFYELKSSLGKETRAAISVDTGTVG